ncbi:MAG: STAS domain-containing protein [Candidatus Obscuribacterales bacterium]|nr:STAS domain-containing protein [Candidatus Obscuribacterales bacterium]
MKAKSYAIIGQIKSSIPEVDGLLAQSPSELTLDFANATFISVEGIEWLEEFLLRCDSKGMKVTFENIPSDIYKVFKVVRIDKIMKACGMLPITGPHC